MLEAVAADPAAIGYLPESVLTSAEPSLAHKVKIIQLDEVLTNALTQPVIAITEEEPQGLTRELIACLQTKEQ